MKIDKDYFNVLGLKREMEIKDLVNSYYKNHINVCLGLKRKPNRKERKDWINALSYLFHYRIMDLYDLMKNNLDYFKTAFKEVHVHDYKYNMGGKRAYRLFQKLSKSSKTKEIEKKVLCEDKLTRSFFKLLRNNPMELIESFIETDIKLRNLLKLQLIINCKLYNNKTTEDNLDVIREIVDYKLSLKLSELKSKDDIEMPVSSSLENIYPISTTGGILNAVYFHKLIPNPVFVDIVDVETCGIAVDIQGSYSEKSRVELFNGLGFKLWEGSIGKDIILPTSGGGELNISIICVRNVKISNIEFSLFTEQNLRNTCGNLYINSKLAESLNGDCVVIIVNSATKEIAIFPDNVIYNLRVDKLVNIFELKKYPELNALGILKSIYGENLRIQKSDPIYDYISIKIILKG